MSNTDENLIPIVLFSFRYWITVQLVILFSKKIIMSQLTPISRMFYLNKSNHRQQFSNIPGLHVSGYVWLYRWPLWCHVSLQLSSTIQLFKFPSSTYMSLEWCHNGYGGVSNHQPHHCLLNHLFRRTSKKTSKLRVTGLWAGNSPVTGEFPAQMANNAENVSIGWRHHVIWSLG